MTLVRFSTVLALVLLVLGAAFASGFLAVGGLALMTFAFFLEEYSLRKKKKATMPTFWQAVVAYLVVFAGVMFAAGELAIPGAVPGWWRLSVLLLLGGAVLATTFVPPPLPNGE